MQDPMNQTPDKTPSALQRSPSRLWRLASAVALASLLPLAFLGCPCPQCPDGGTPPQPSCSGAASGATTASGTTSGPAACVPPAPAPTAAQDSCTCKVPDTGAGPDWHQQSAELAGTGITGCAGSPRARVRTFTLASAKKGGQIVDGARVDKGRLAGNYCGAPLAPMDWVGVELEGDIACVNGSGDKPVTARITAVMPHPDLDVPDTALYSVEIKSPDTGAWTPACADGAPAIPLAGMWSNTALRVGLVASDPPAMQGKVTFACTNAAIGKCYQWGYVPWRDAEHATLHAACTRMARADYCGNGTAYTTNGTAVDVWDTAKIQLRSPPSAAAPFEAAWGPNGAVCRSHARVSTASKPGCYCALPVCADDSALPASATGPLVFDSSAPKTPALSCP